MINILGDPIFIRTIRTQYQCVYVRVGVGRGEGAGAIRISFVFCKF